MVDESDQKTFDFPRIQDENGMSEGESDSRDSGGNGDQTSDTGQEEQTSPDERVPPVERMEKAIEPAVWREIKQAVETTPQSGGKGEMVIGGVTLEIKSGDTLEAVAYQYLIGCKWEALSDTRREFFGLQKSGEEYDYVLDGLYHCHCCGQKKDHLRVPAPESESETFHVTCVGCGVVRSERGGKQSQTSDHPSEDRSEDRGSQGEQGKRDPRGREHG